MKQGGFMVDRKQQAIYDMTSALVKASTVDLVAARDHLEWKIGQGSVRNLPTCEVFYDFATLFNINRSVLLPKYKELTELKKDGMIPKNIGGINPITILNNKRYYITPILRKSDELGFSKIFVDNNGISFFLKMENLGPVAKAYYDLTAQLVQLVEVSKADVVLKLEEITHHPNSCPTHGAFFPYTKLLAGRTNYPELREMKPECHPDQLIRQIGPYGLELEMIFQNQEFYISKIVRRAKEMGLEGANVGQNGITYYVNPDELGVNAKRLYRQFFLDREGISRAVITQRTEKVLLEEKMLIFTYQKFLGHSQLQRVNYELRKHYNKLGFSVNLSYDWPYEKEDEPLVMKLFVDLADFKKEIQEGVVGDLGEELSSSEEGGSEMVGGEVGKETVEWIAENRGKQLSAKKESEPIDIPESVGKGGSQSPQCPSPRSMYTRQTNLPRFNIEELEKLSGGGELSFYHQEPTGGRGSGMGRGNGVCQNLNGNPCRPNRF